MPSVRGEIGGSCDRCRRITTIRYLERSDEWRCFCCTPARRFTAKCAVCAITKTLERLYRIDNRKVLLCHRHVGVQVHRP